MTQAPLTLRRWKRIEYDRLVDLGVFEGEPLELIGGQLIVAEPKGTYHSSAVSTAEYALRACLPSGWIVRTQLPVSLDDESEPEPARRRPHRRRSSCSPSEGGSELKRLDVDAGSSTRAASTRGQELRTTGSSTSSIASSRSTAIRVRTRRRSTDGGTAPSRRWRRRPSLFRSRSRPVRSPCSICCPSGSVAHPRRLRSRPRLGASRFPLWSNPAPAAPRRCAGPGAGVESRCSVRRRRT